MTTIVSLYQAGKVSRFCSARPFVTVLSHAGEQLYEHFDKVCVIYEGRMAYFGAAGSARQYFIDIGFEPAPRQTTADYLVAGKVLMFSEGYARLTLAYSSDRPQCSDRTTKL